MSGRKRKISLNISLSTPPPTSSSSSTTLNTPDILDTVLNITAENTFHKLSQIQPIPSDQLTAATCTISTMSQLSVETLPGQPCSYTERYQYHSHRVKEGLKMKLQQKIKEEPEPALKWERKRIKHENEVGYHINYGNFISPKN